MTETTSPHRIQLAADPSAPRLSWGPKRRLPPVDQVWSIRARLQIERRVRGWSASRQVHSWGTSAATAMRRRNHR
jgi:hypothetical protein